MASRLHLNSRLYLSTQFVKRQTVREANCPKQSIRLAATLHPGAGCSVGVPTRAFMPGGMGVRRGWGHPRYNQVNRIAAGGFGDAITCGGAHLPTNQKKFRGKCYHREHLVEERKPQICSTKRKRLIATN
jgi:hypothetical protein